MLRKSKGLSLKGQPLSLGAGNFLIDVHFSTVQYGCFGNSRYYYSVVLRRY